VSFDAPTLTDNWAQLCLALVFFAVSRNTILPPIAHPICILAGAIVMPVHGQRNLYFVLHLKFVLNY